MERIELPQNIAREIGIDEDYERYVGDFPERSSDDDDFDDEDEFEDYEDNDEEDD